MSSKSTELNIVDQLSSGPGFLVAWLCSQCSQELQSECAPDISHSAPPKQTYHLSFSGCFSSIVHYLPWFTQILNLGNVQISSPWVKWDWSYLWKFQTQNLGSRGTVELYPFKFLEIIFIKFFLVEKKGVLISLFRPRGLTFSPTGFTESRSNHLFHQPSKNNEANFFSFFFLSFWF